MKKIANKLSIELVLEGKGLVNMNGNTPPERFRGQMLNNGKISENGTFGKEVVYSETIIGKDGETKTFKNGKKIISSNLLRKQILGDENQVNADVLSKLDDLRPAILSQDKIIARGYCILGKDGESIKRSSAICVTDAEQISNTVTSLETRTSEGIRNDKSLFFVENCGDIQYKSDIKVDVRQLQFVSVDDNYDRISIKEKDVASYIQHVESRYGEDSAKFGNWATTPTNVMGEQGIVLSNKVVSNIVREIILGVLGVNIRRSGSYAKTLSVKIGVGYSTDKLDLLIKPNLVTINSIEEYDKIIDGIEFGVEFLEVLPPTVVREEKDAKKKKIKI